MKISAMRYRAGGGEIDIIARNGEEIVFVEVKYRPEGVLGEGVRAVNREKQNRIRSAAKVYLAQKQLSNHPLRFDVIEITPAGIRHLERAF